MGWVPTGRVRVQLDGLRKTEDWLLSEDAGLQSYGGMWVAAADCRVIASHENYGGLLEILRDLDPQACVVMALSSRISVDRPHVGDDSDEGHPGSGEYYDLAHTD